MREKRENGWDYSTNFGAGPIYPTNNISPVDTTNSMKNTKEKGNILEGLETVLDIVEIIGDIADIFN